VLCAFFGTGVDSSWFSGFVEVLFSGRRSVLYVGRFIYC